MDKSDVHQHPSNTREDILTEFPQLIVFAISTIFCACFTNGASIIEPLNVNAPFPFDSWS